MQCKVGEAGIVAPHINNAVRMSSTAEDHDITVPRVSFQQIFNGLVNRKVTVIFEKEEESMTPTSPINNRDFTIPE